MLAVPPLRAIAGDVYAPALSVTDPVGVPAAPLTVTATGKS